MSEQRRMRAELHQGLSQFLMQLYFSYTESMGKDDATQHILEVLKEQYEYFSGQGLPTEGANDSLRELANSYYKQAQESKVFEEQMHLQEKAEALEKAYDILQEKG